jgi:tetratricopeptide (TPR) repeat protein
MLEKSGDMERAFNNYRKLYDMNPGNWEANLGLYSYYTGKNMAAEALVIGENLYRISPYSVHGITAAGFANYLNRSYDRAIGIYQKGLAERPDYYDILYHLSAVYGATGDTEKAAFYAEKAVAASKDNQGAYYNLAVAYYRAGDKSKAIATIKSMLKEHPGDTKALELLKAVRK